MEDKSQLDTRQFGAAINTGVTLVDLNVPWCRPCRVQEPIIKKIAKRFEGKATIIEINVDDNRETAAGLCIRSIPTLIIYKDGREIRRLFGIQSEQSLTQAIENVLG
jgi:thioredoxin 1